MRDANWVRGIVQSMLSRIGVPRWGTVTGVNPAIPACKVLYQPEGIESGWLPVKGMAAGGMTVITLPTAGDQVQVHPDTGDMEHGVVSGASHSTKLPPPISPVTGKPCQSGEFLIYVNGLYFHITGGNVFIGGGNLVVAGNITATGDITAGLGTGDQVDLLNHTHPYLPGSGSTTQTGRPAAGT